jgi:hypothetical protein
MPRRGTAGVTGENVNAPMDALKTAVQTTIGTASLPPVLRHLHRKVQAHVREQREAEGIGEWGPGEAPEVQG